MSANLHPGASGEDSELSRTFRVPLRRGLFGKHLIHIQSVALEGLKDATKLLQPLGFMENTSQRKLRGKPRSKLCCQRFFCLSNACRLIAEGGGDNDNRNLLCNSRALLDLSCFCLSHPLLLDKTAQMLVPTPRTLSDNTVLYMALPLELVHRGEIPNTPVAPRRSCRQAARCEILAILLSGHLKSQRSSSNKPSSTRYFGKLLQCAGMAGLDGWRMLSRHTSSSSTCINISSCFFVLDRWGNEV